MLHSFTVNIVHLGFLRPPEGRHYVLLEAYLLFLIILDAKIISELAERFPPDVYRIGADADLAKFTQISPLRHSSKFHRFPRNFLSFAVVSIRNYLSKT